MSNLIFHPENGEAKRIANDSQNESYVMRGGDGKRLLRVSLRNVSKGKGDYLVTFGRDPDICDIVLGNSKYYSKLHCCIYINRNLVNWFYWTNL